MQQQPTSFKTESIARYPTKAHDVTESETFSDDRKGRKQRARQTGGAFQRASPSGMSVN